MTIPTANELEIVFLQAGKIRLNNSKYANDSDYWIGGNCNWGGNHNLKKDCETLVRGFGKIESLGKLLKELRECTSKNEFDNKKRIHLNKCDELISSLSNKSAGSCMFGICCIWSDNNMSENVQRFIEQTKVGITNFKSALTNENYSWIEEIREIDLEIEKTKDKMEKNKQKAMSPDTSPEEKIILLKEIEKDGKILEQKINKKFQMENVLNFDAGSYVRNIIEVMKKAVEGSNSTGDNSGEGNNDNQTPPNPETPRNPNSSNSDNTDPKPNTSSDNQTDTQKDTNSTSPTQNQQRLLIFGGAAILVIFYLYSQNQEIEASSNFYNYDY